MLPAVIVFVVVVSIILGLYWLFILRPEQELIDRLKPKEEQLKAQRRGGIIKAPEETVSTVGPLKSLLAKSSSAQRVQTFIQQSGVKMTVATFLLLTVVAGLGAFVLTRVLIQFLILAVLAGALAASLPYAYISRMRTVRTRKFEEHFPEAIDLISRALRAGHALPTGLQMVGDEIPAPVGTEFKLLYDQQNFGMTLPDALRVMASRVPVLDARFFVTAVLTQRDTGGNLAEVLDNLSAIIRERFKVKRQIRVISAHGRITGWVLAALPPSLAVVTLLINKDHLGTLTGDPLGQQMIIAAILMQVVGTLIIRKIVNIEY